MLGLKSAALSSEYSLVKYEPISNCRLFGNGHVAGQIFPHLREPLGQDVCDPLMAISEVIQNLIDQRADCSSDKARIRARIKRARGESIDFISVPPTAAGKKGRMSTRAGIRPQRQRQTANR